jgi:anti-anti-sigma factor
MDRALAIEADDAGAVTVVRCVGEIDISTRRDLRTALNAALEKGPTSIRIDLTAVTFIDSTGLSCLYDMQEHCDHANVPLEMTVPPDGSVRRLFMITSAHRLFNLTEAADVAGPADASAPR